ncbi:hypothetical protein [Spartinivicinus poritis]|uniref:Uncharacterized protein n=1 Tax=Spartinivicinus poritis TaxID=2994640 RepID=A0ABT5UEG0_9GAMM|nr:hypothetical protein [Spartinivicinus sp. A2-2]MDE1464769.1 hypothetical protein [Spartinivicinus sp. A2-2]
MLEIISHQNREECQTFFESYFCNKNKNVLFIGTLGFNSACLHFPKLISSINKFLPPKYIFLNEIRPEVSPVLNQTASRNKARLEELINHGALSFPELQIVADDTANVAGRNAIRILGNLMNGSSYTDVIVDATTMSRGVCFPVVKYVFEQKKKVSSMDVHVVIAEDQGFPLNVSSMSSDSAEYMHGFQKDMETDGATQSIKLWLPQLSEDNLSSLRKIHSKIHAEEVAPILPFPSSNPRRADDLLIKFHEPIVKEWDTNLLDFIYAHESDPTDVFESIKRIEKGRTEALKSYPEHPTRMILSPTGRKIGSLGMLFAAIDLDLPVMYTETMGYQCTAQDVPDIPISEPIKMWHNWLVEKPNA